MALTLGVMEYLISVNKKGVDEGIRETEKEVKASGQRTQRELNNFGNKFSAWTVAKGQMIARVAESAARSATSAIKSTVRGAVDTFARFEQLEGGVKKIFKENYLDVMNNAAKAYKAVGISANQYMQNVTEFSSALIAGLGGDTKKAAEIADQALIDMADNANTFGSSIESVQNAYRGFSRQVYTMLDNLNTMGALAA